MADSEQPEKQDVTDEPEDTTVKEEQTAEDMGNKDVLEEDDDFEEFEDGGMFYSST